MPPGAIASAEVVIVTIGSALDFFLPGGASADQTQPESEVAPKFLLLADTEDADKRAGLAQRLKAQGTTFRLGTFAESKTAIRRFYTAVRALNPHALCLFTLSPVPMDSAIGLQKTTPSGAAEIDCVSKSTPPLSTKDIYLLVNQRFPCDFWVRCEGDQDV